MKKPCPELQYEEFYWLNAPAIDPMNPLMIGQYDYNGFGSQKQNVWWIKGHRYNAGAGIDPIKRIPRPRNKETSQ